MANTRDIKFEQQAIFALLKGDPKTGKSVAAHSFPDTYTMLYDVGRMPSVANFYPGRDFEYDTFPDLIMSNNKLEELKTNCPYKTIIFDGITRFGILAEQCMIDHRMPNISASSKTVRAGVPMTEIEDFGGTYRAMIMTLNSLLAIHIKWNVHVLVIGHVITVETMNIKTKQATIQRSLLTSGKKAAAVLPVDFNEVYHFYVNSSTDPSNPNPEFIAWTKSNGYDWASSALGLPTTIEWTNKSFYDQVMAALRGKDMWR